MHGLYQGVNKESLALCFSRVSKMHWSESNNVQTTFIEMHHHQEISPKIWKGSDYCVFLTNSIHVCPFVWQRQKMMEQFDKTPTIESTNHTQNFRTVRRWGCLKRISSLKKSPRTFFVRYTFHIFFVKMDNKNVTMALHALKNWLLYPLFIFPPIWTFLA